MADLGQTRLIEVQLLGADWAFAFVIFYKELLGRGVILVVVVERPKLVTSALLKGVDLGGTMRL